MIGPAGWPSGPVAAARASTMPRISADLSPPTPTTCQERPVTAAYGAGQVRQDLATGGRDAHSHHRRANGLGGDRQASHAAPSRQPTSIDGITLSDGRHMGERSPRGGRRYLRALGINNEPQMRRADEAVLSPGYYRRSPVSSVAWQGQHRGRWRSVDATALAVHVQKAPRQRRASCWAGFGRNCRRLAGPALSSLTSRLSGRAAAGGAAAAWPPVEPEGAASCGSRPSKRGRSCCRIRGGCRRSPSPRRLCCAAGLWATRTRIRAPLWALRDSRTATPPALSRVPPRERTRIVGSIPCSSLSRRRVLVWSVSS